MNRWALALSILLLALPVAADEKIPYEKFEPDKTCGTCHPGIARQHEQAMMSQAFTHSWDEIEYFQLALPHALKEPKVAGIKEGCNGCHAPLAFLAGDIPPKPPAEKTRANDGVSCDLCHTIVAVKDDVPYNFNYVVQPGRIKQGSRAGVESPYHAAVRNPLFRTAELCGTCHNEKSPFDTWVKATHLEWKESPQAKAGIVCQDCHMAPSANRAAVTGKDHPDMREHLFHGAHDTGKLIGSVEVRIHPSTRQTKAGEKVKLTAVVLNQKAGHKIPTGSAEERVVWLDVRATDAKGTSYHLAVDPKNFKGEEYTIASSSAMAYQDIGEIRDIPNFPGLLRDGNVPAGDRIFRLPYLDPKGRMTIAQWNTASFGPDYRLAPLAAVTETFTWKLPADIAPGPVSIRARVYYSKLVSSVAEYMNVPKEEAEAIEIAGHASGFTIVQ
jgi:hypothetical protein